MQLWSEANRLGLLSNILAHAKLTEHNQTIIHPLIGGFLSNLQAIDPRVKAEYTYVLGDLKRRAEGHEEFMTTILLCQACRASVLLPLAKQGPWLTCQVRCPL